MEGSKAATVLPVTAFGISSSVMPRAIFAATRAMGYPVALLARAEERDTRGLTSMTRYSPVSLRKANWTLQPPSIFRARMHFSDAVRSIWWSWSLSVCEGATTMDSPVWTPIGSRFSMLQMMMQLSLASRITSYSNSSQPSRDSSMRTWRMRE
jgi:hypothetical protein